MIKITDVSEGIILSLTDKETLLKEYPDLDVGLYEIMEQSDFAPEWSKNTDWDDISISFDHPAIGYKIYYDGAALCHSIDMDYQMFEYKELEGRNLMQELVEKQQLLFTPFDFER
ncbi:MAG: hypothetical protein LPK21_16740 [Hymenobacteraceae bacterium]|nr:hypothetical protein [Hymenobacteraceae bacterium]